MERRMGFHGASRALLPRSGRSRCGPFLLVLGVTASAMLANLPQPAAQTPPVLTLELVAQTPWVAPTDTRFSVRVLARNQGDEPVEDLDVRIVLGPAFTSRNEYEDSLLTGPTITTFSQRTVFPGEIAPGGVRQFQVLLDPSALEADVLSPIDSRVYPLRVEVRSGAKVIGSLHTSLVSIFQEPERRVLFSWWTELDAPLPLDAEGKLVDDTGFEAAIAEGGTLWAQARALAELARSETESAIDVVVTPALLEQLVRMSDGYGRATGDTVLRESAGAEAAADLLETLSVVAGAPQVQVSSVPFAAPSIPALLASGLGSDLERQRELAATWTREAIGVEPAIVVARPPGGALDDQTLEWLEARGVRVVLADADTVERPEQLNEFAVPSTAVVNTERGPVTLVLPDPGAQALLERDDLLDDPVLAAQAVFAELAVIWREQPVPPPQPDGSPTQRGLALRLPADLPADLWDPLIGRLSKAPFLLPVPAQDLAAQVNPPGEPTALRASSSEAFSDAYADDIRGLRRQVDDFESMLTESSPVPDRLRLDLLVAESHRYLADEVAGRAWLEDAAKTTAAVFKRVTPSVQSFTLTSREGTIPLLMGDPGPIPLRVTLELRSSRFEFPGGNRREVLLEGPNQIVQFDVVSTTAGRHEIEVIVEAPSGRVISVRRMEVRSTALNAIALLVTGAAAFGLLLLWLRRWFRRRTTS